MTSQSVSKNRRLVGNTAILIAYFGLMMGLWNEYSWYSDMAPYGTVICLPALAVAFFAYVNIKDAFRDPVFWMMIVGDAFALVNLFLIGSNKGAFLTAADFLLILYLANKIRIPRKLFYYILGITGFFFFYWTFDVKGYFKGYNTNYGGLVLITGFIFAMIGFECLRRHLKKRGREKAAKWMLLWYVWMFAWGYNIIAWYRARCAFLALMVFALLLILPGKLWNNKWLYMLLCLGTTVGAAVFSLVYIGLGNLTGGVNIQLFYKNAISGREEIWRELWGAFLKQPITGIGSSYVMHIDWLEGMFEAHSGMLDILFVHGIVVFVITVALLIKRLWQLREGAVSSNTGRFIMAGAMAMLCAGFLENYFIVPPFSLSLFLLLVAGNCENSDNLI